MTLFAWMVYGFVASIAFTRMFPSEMTLWTALIIFALFTLLGGLNDFVSELMKWTQP